MTAGCLRSSNPGAPSPGYLLLGCLLLLGGLVSATDTGDAECTPEEIASSDVAVSSSSASQTLSQDMVWCPQMNDTDPSIHFDLADTAFGVWGLRKVKMRFATGDSPDRYDDYASTYNITVQLESQGDWYTLAENAKAVTRNGSNFVIWTTVLEHPLPFSGLRLFPVSSLTEGGGLCMNVTLLGCRIFDLCPPDFCGDQGQCRGENLCSCEDGFFGTRCSMTAYEMVRTVYRLVWTATSETEVSTEVGQFTCSMSGGFSISGTTLTLSGSRSFLYSSALSGDYLCLLNPDGCASLYVSFTYALREFGSSMIGLFGTSADESQKGVSAWISESADHTGVYYLNVVVRRVNSVWMVSTRADAIQTVNVWTQLEISWTLADGLTLFVQGSEVGRDLKSSKSDLAAASYFVIGFPSYSYAETYEVQLLVREFTVSSQSRRQTLLAFAESCPGSCENGGLCSDMHQCTCLGDYYGPGCRYTDAGASLEMSSQEETSLVTNLGAFSLAGSGNVSFTANMRGFSIEGDDTFLYSSDSLTAPWNALLDTSLSSAFTVALRFSAEGSGFAHYVMCSGVDRAWTGVNVLVTETRLLVVQVKLAQAQWEVGYQVESEEDLSRGLLIEFTFDSSTLILYVNGEEKATASNATSTELLTTSTGSLVFGAPAEDPLDSENVKGGLTVQELRMWTKTRDEVTKVEEPGEAVDQEPDEGEEPEEPETETSECSTKSFASLEKTVVNLTLSLLTMAPVDRLQCLTLQNVTETAERRVETCWESAEARVDSTSGEAFLKYVKTEELREFKSIATALCEDSIPAEPSDGCSLPAMEVELSHFFDLAAEYGMGQVRCSLLWSSHARFMELYTRCSADTQSMLRALKAQVSQQSSMACSPSACNRDFAMMCVSAGRDTISSFADDMDTSGEKCSDLKLALACATNHTLDCSGSSYSLLIESIGFVRAQYRLHCNVTEPETSPTGQITAEDALLMLETAAEARTFPKEVICSLALRKEWFGEDPKTSPLFLSSSVLTDLCLDKPEQPPACQCDDDVESRMLEISGNLVTASLTQDTSVCNSSERAIQALFSAMTGCDSEFKSQQVETLENRFSQLCGMSLDTDGLICPTDCDISACEASICGDISECLAQNSAGCEEQQVLVSALHYHSVRKDCTLEGDDAGVSLTNRPELDGVLQCMKTAAAVVAGEISLPLGQFCGALDTLSVCTEALETEQQAANDTRGASAAGHSRAVLKMISTAVCDFMPETACGKGSKADVVFILDESSSVGPEDMNLLLSFIGDVLSEWDIDEDKIRVGVAKFSDEAVLEFHLSRYDDKEDVIDAIRNIGYKGGTTNTATALTFMADEMFSEENGNRRGVPDFGVIITDGRSNDRDATLAAAEAAKQKGITVLSVGVGDRLDMEELEAMASAPSTKHMLTVANYSQLVAVQADFFKQTCSSISDFQTPFTPSEGGQCSALHEVIKSAQTRLLGAMAAPHYSLAAQEKMCSNLPTTVEDVSDCGEEERDYLQQLQGRMVGTLNRLCLRAEPEKGCNLPAATSCLEELVNGFVLPAVSPCSLYSKVEVCVRQNTVECPAAEAWPLTQSLTHWKELAASTCIKGPCDPAEAVLCYFDVHYMAKSPVPDWEGICSSLESSMECAERNVIGCDRCQRDTIKTIGGKINIPLVEKCKDPPEFKCRALAAMECKEKLTKFTKSSSGEPDGLLCLKVFEARKCITDLTAECDSATRLSVSVELEEMVTSAGGESCSKDKILPVCYQTLADRVHTILSFDPLDRSDPAYKYRPESQDKDDVTKSEDSKDKDSKASGSKSKKSKDSQGSEKSKKSSKGKSSGKKSKSMSDSSSRSKKSSKKSKSESRGSEKSSRGSAESWSMESVEEVDFPATYMGKICREAQMAYLCVSESLEEFPPSSVVGLADVITTTWKLAWLRCEDVVEPLSCYTCNNVTDNEACNSNELVECGAEFQMCQTEVLNEKDGTVISIEKSCAVPFECKPGCKDSTCTYCCDTQGGCNEPDDGPLTGSCRLLEVAGCLSELTSVVLETDTVNCSMVQEQVACVDNARKECKANGKKKVAETLSEFLGSKSVAQCQVELTDSRCGLYTVSAVASLLVSGLTPDTMDSCALLSSIESGIEAAASQKEICGEEEVKAVNASFDLLRRQMWSLDCSPTIKPQDICEPLAAYSQCMPESSSDCDLTKKVACISNLTQGCHPVQQIFPLIALRIGAILHCSSDPDSVEAPDLSEDLRPLSDCLETFIASFNASLVDPVSLFAPVNQLATCLLTSWDVDFILGQPPIFKVYIKEVFYFLETVLLPAVRLREGEGSVTVTTECAAGLASTSATFSQEIMLMLLRPFRSFSMSDDFCILSRELEVDVIAQLSSCTLEEKKYHLRLFMELQAYRLALCPDTEPLPQCSVEQASQCLNRFTAFMDIAMDRDSVDKCSALNNTLTCVKAYTSTCNVSETDTVNQAVIELVSVYRSTCSEMLMDTVCDVETTEGTPACEDPSASLETCDSMSISVSCSSIKKVLACYSEAVGACTSDTETYQDRFKNAFPVQYGFAATVCGLDLDSWIITGDGCAAPLCDPQAAAACLSVNDLTNNETAHSELPSRVASAVACLQGNLSGCDVTVRAHVIYKARAQLLLLIGIFPSLANLDLKLQVEFSDPFGEWVQILVDFTELLDQAVYNPKWDLLPLCWWLHDFNLFVTEATEDNAFRTELLKRTSLGLQKTLEDVCNEPNTMGVILDLPPIDDEDSACPAKEFMQNASTSFFEAAVTGILQQESHTRLCNALETVEQLDLSMCSSGRQRQVRMMVNFFQLVASQVCTKARYCNVSEVQECVLEVGTTVMGLGRETSTNQVCRSISTLDACVGQFSYMCDDSSVMRIKASTLFVRQMAVTACGEMVADKPLPTCTDPDNSECDLQKVQRCIFNEFYDLLSDFSDKDVHCRTLKLTQDCYDRANKSCTDENALVMYGVSLNSLEYLRNKWDCNDTTDESSVPAVCTKNCDFTEALKCTENLSQALRFWSPLKGDVCSVVTTARECVMDKTSECKSSDRNDFHQRLKTVLDLHHSLTSHCVDVYTCLDSLFTISREILSTEDAPKPSSESGSSEKSSGEDSSGKSSKDSGKSSKDSGKSSKDSGKGSKDSGKGSKNSGKGSKNSGKGSKNSGKGSREADQGSGGNSLLYLCQQAHQSWECAERGLKNLPKAQRDLLQRVIEPLWTVISDSCADSVPLQCYTCSNVSLLHSLSDDICQEDTEVCRHNERCSSMYTEIDNNVYVTRGCMKFAHCHAKDKKNVDVKCCDNDLCNTNADISTEPDMETKCYLAFAVDCAFTFAENLVTRGSVDCRSAMEKLQCASKYSKHCPAAQTLHKAASQLMLTLAQTTCVQGALTEGCSSIAVSSMQAILSNAYSSDFACSGLSASTASLDLQEQSGECTALDLVALREMLSFTNILSFEACHPDDCQSPSAPSGPSAPQTEKTEDREDCNFMETSLCARDAHKGFQEWSQENQNDTCSDIKDDAQCAVTKLEGCEVPPCLQGLINEVKQKAQDKCDMDFTSSDEDEDAEGSQEGEEEECRPSIVCDIESSLACVDSLASVNESELCMKLEETMECHSSHTASCRSILTAFATAYFNITLGTAIARCEESLELQLPTDVYSSGAECNYNLLMQMTSAFASSSLVEPLCSAAAEYQACPVTLPDISNGFLMDGTKEMLSYIASPEICQSGEQDPPVGERKKRATISCSLEDRGRAATVVLISSNFKSLPLASRHGLCVRLRSALDVIAEHISECDHLSLADVEGKVLQALFDYGSQKQEEFCVLLEYEPASCRPDLFPLCMESFSTMSSFSKAEPDTLCRAAESGLTCLRKFTTDCTEDMGPRLDAVWGQVRAVLGNSCPNLTLGLFCPHTYPSLRNSFPCHPDTARTCLPSADDVGGIKRLNPFYCSNLRKSLTCARDGVEGCLSSDIQDVQDTLDGLGSLDAEVTFCASEGVNVSANLLGYGSACVAQQPCSVKAAVTCFQLEEEDDPTDCQVLLRIRSCVDTSLESCAASMEVVSVVHSLFSVGFESKNLTCTAPFEGLSSESNSTCSKTFAEDFVSALKTGRTKVGVCNVFQDYKDCVSSTAHSTAHLASVLKPISGFLDDMTSLFCGTDTNPVNASTAEVSSSCDLDTASFCLIQEVMWVFSRQLLPTSDNLHFCQKWHNQELRTCVTEATSKCSGPIQTLYETVVDMSNRLVLSSGVCDSVKVCYMEEAYHHINQFSVAIANFTIDKDADSLCLEKQNTETKVGTFTGTCSRSQKRRAEISLSKAAALVEGICEDVVLPPAPICPDLPLDHQRCNIGAAFTCVLDFNKELLHQQGIPLFWRDWCTSLENTMQCAAFNTSSCDRGEANLNTVISSLGDFRKAAGNHCHWLTTDLCSRTARCPAQDASCDIKLQINLLKNPLSDVCLFIKEADVCVEQNTVTCTPAQKVVANETIQRRLQQLSVPNLKCDGLELAPCLLRAKAASWQVLTKLGGDNDTRACDTVTAASQCLVYRVAQLPNGPTLQQQTANNMSIDLTAFVGGWCSSSGTRNCSTAVAQVINTLYNLAISLTTDMFDKAVICSARQAVLSDIAEIRSLHSDTCDFTGLEDIEERLSSGVFGQCVINIEADCLKANTSASDCLSSFNTVSYGCSDLNSLMVCIAPALGLCEPAVYEPIVTQLQSLLSQPDSCVRPPIFALSTPASSPLYLSEQGGFVDIKFQFKEDYTAFAAAANRSVHIRAQVSNTDPPTCLEEGSEAISQVSVLYTSDSPCGVQLDSKEKWTDPHAIRLVANLDGREDSMQQATVSLYADVYVYDTDAWVKNNQSFMLATYEVNIKDTDMYAVCSSVGAHTETFDGTLFSNYEAGEFVMYRNTFIDGQVTVSYQQCAQAATCTCAVKVSTQGTSVEFDRCQRVGASSAPQDIKVKMTGDKEPDGLLVYRHKNLKNYYVVLPTGAIVTVKASVYYLDVWISASSFDFGKTEGLCGLFDLDAYNDLILPSGESYIMEEGDIQYGMLSPTGFINQWQSSLLSDSLGMAATPSCSCLDSNPSADQCSDVSRVATCDFVQGEDITQLLAEAADPDTDAKRRRRAAESNVVDYTTNFTQNVGWPTASNWTEEKAREHCENLLEGTMALKYCAQAILLASGTYPYERHISTCVDNIRLSDSTKNDDFTIIQAMENCRSLFLHNTTYQNSHAARPTVLLFFDHTCADNCNGNGDCRMGVCHCYPGFVGGNCSYQRTDLPRPFNTDVIRNGLCEVSSTSQCDNVFVTGQSFVGSPYLSCHIQPAQVSATGVKSRVGLPTKVPATLVTATMVHCPLTRSSDAQQTVMVEISNDGISPSASMLYTAYDPRCYVCDPYSHHCRHIATSTCEIEGQCHMPGEAPAKDECLFCNPLKTAKQWSVRDLPECEDRRDSSEEDTDDDDDSGTEISPLLIGILAVGAGLLLLGVVGIAVCLLKTRHRRPPGRDHEFGSPPSYDNAGYMSGMDGQVFNQGAIHKRAVIREASHIPSTVPSNWE